METKPGIRTSEFYVTALVSAPAILNLLGLWNWASNWHGGILLTGIGIAYVLSRGQAKKGVPFDINEYEKWRAKYGIDSMPGGSIPRKP
jgi:small neutral amino acid transporter SnatA (MarC family)